MLHAVRRRGGTGHGARRLAQAVAVTGLVGSVLMAAPAQAQVTATADGKPCPPGTMSNAKLKPGATVADPNTVSAATAAQMDAALDARLKAQGLRSGTAETTARGADPIIIRVRFHVITRNNGTGGVTKQQIKDQMKVLNDGYAGRTADGAAATPLRFRLQSVDRTRNSDWYNWSIDTDTDDAEAKAALHEGGYETLNVYVAGLGDGLLGYATFPGGPLVEDGVVVLNESLPGGDAAPFNLGDTLTHEVGHWLLLYHTFEGSCTTPGDEVADTPYQFAGDNVFSCDESLDTCPRRPGLDPVHNFMSYGDDECLDEFTVGQADRQLEAWLAYRA